MGLFQSKTVKKQSDIFTINNEEDAINYDDILSIDLFYTYKDQDLSNKDLIKFLWLINRYIYITISIKKQEIHTDIIDYLKKLLLVDDKKITNQCKYYICKSLLISSSLPIYTLNYNHVYDQQLLLYNLKVLCQYIPNRHSTIYNIPYLYQQVIDYDDLYTKISLQLLLLSLISVISSKDDQMMNIPSKNDDQMMNIPSKNDDPSKNDQKINISSKDDQKINIDQQYTINMDNIQIHKLIINVPILQCSFDHLTTIDVNQKLIDCFITLFNDVDQAYQSLLPYSTAYFTAYQELIVLFFIYLSFNQSFYQQIKKINYNRFLKRYYRQLWIRYNLMKI